MPNTINKLFSFLRNKSKSKMIVDKLLEERNELGRNCTAAKFYAYQNYLKSKTNKFLIEENIEKLFHIIDQEHDLFSRR